jgi:hypothetical protein
MNSNLNHSIICPTHGPLVPLKEHAHYVAKFFVYEHPYEDRDVTAWFQIAAGIKNVEYFGEPFDDSFMWCRPAWEYEDEKSKFHARLIKALTVFTYIWGGFECLTDSLKLRSCPHQKGKINAVCYFLECYFESDFSVLRYYDDLLVYLKKLLDQNPWYDPQKILKKKNCASVSSEGLAIVYQIRNKLAHGAFKFSEPAAFNSIKPYDIQIIAASCRIVLLTVQMILLVLYKNNNVKVGGNPFYADLDDSGIEAAAYLNTLHLKEKA